ncbi:MAG: aspartate aminotransferase family protein [Halobacteriaceae archaeon]
MTTEDDADAGRNEHSSAVRRYYERTPTSRELNERARASMPGGSTRNATYTDPYPTYLVEGEGSRVVDEDGTEYVDFLNDYTTLVHGHAPEPVVERAVERVRRGAALGGASRPQVEWAEHMVERSPAVEQIRFTNSGTEATMNAVRAARAYTGNDLLAKFEGCYHGTHNDVQVSVDPPSHLAGPRAAPESVPESAGLPDSVTADVLTLPFNDPSATVDALERHREDLAGVIVSPMMGSAVVPGTRAFVERLAGWTTEADVPLIFDEVISFRVAHGGAHDVYGVDPDLVTFGKIIGGGFPVGAFGGRADLMAGFDPSGGPDITHSGTFNANPATAAAGLAALEAYDADAVARVNDLAADLVARARDVIDDRGYRLQVTHRGSLFNLYCSATPLTDHRDVAAAHPDVERDLYFELLDEGLWLSHSLLGCTSTAMDGGDVDAFVSGLDAALARLRPEVEARAPDLLA